MTVRWLMIAFFLTLPTLLDAGEKKKEEAKKDAPKAEAKLVPYRLSDTHHTIVRVKINGKGPFNFVVDTGCPVFLIAEPVGKKVGLKVENGWATLDKLDLEGGLELNNVKARVETPFQIEGMNGMGLAGVELHGLMGYTVLAKYKMNFDYTKKHMAWQPLAFDPPLPMPVAKGAKLATGGMDMMVGLVRMLTFFAGIGPAPQPQPRGFFGFELTEASEKVTVAAVLPKSPADAAGLKRGDLIVEIEGNEIRSVADVMRHTAKMTAGKTLGIEIERDKKKHELKITAGRGL